jgi:hypothetical protein
MAKKHQIESKFNRHDNLIQSLIFASYQIPRLLCIAFMVWIHFQNSATNRNKHQVLQKFQETAALYYYELFELSESLTISDLSHLLLCCGVRFSVTNIRNIVPGTSISWKSLIEKSVIFPAPDGSYQVPFQLIWKGSDSTSNKLIGKRLDIERYCRELVPGLVLTDLFLTFDHLVEVVGNDWIFALVKVLFSSMAVKRYLDSLTCNSLNNYLRIFKGDSSRKHTDESSERCMSLQSFLTESDRVSNIPLGVRLDISRTHLSIFLRIKQEEIIFCVKLTKELSDAIFRHEDLLRWITSDQMTNFSSRWIVQIDGVNVLNRINFKIYSSLIFQKIEGTSNGIVFINN